jgi:hypothetical protein
MLLTLQIAGGILIAMAILAVLKRLPQWAERRQEENIWKSLNRHSEYVKKLAADPETKKLLLDDADWLRSVPKRDDD